jgi:hypothetical protein
MKFSGTLSHPSRQDKARLSRLLPVDAAYLENLVRFTGVLVALVASFLAAPEATRHRWTWLRTHAVTTSQTVAAQSRATAAQAKRAWRRLLGRRPPPRIVPVGQVAEHVTIHPGGHRYERPGVPGGSSPAAGGFFAEFRLGSGTHDPRTAMSLLEPDLQRGPRSAPGFQTAAASVRPGTVRTLAGAAVTKSICPSQRGN